MSQTNKVSKSTKAVSEFASTPASAIKKLTREKEIPFCINFTEVYVNG